MIGSEFYILLHIRTAQGMQPFAKFSIGNNREMATELFSRLPGSPDVDDNTLLSVELMEEQKGLPLNIKLKACTLRDISENCTIITKEIFKNHNLPR
jgi:hypothetical protein